MMLEESFDRRWMEIKNHITQRWSRLNASDLDSLKGNLDELVTRVQVAYGCAHARAEREYHEFRTSLRPLLQPAVVAPVARPVRNRF